MVTLIELPQVGESVTEGVIGKWLVEPGQRIEKYDSLVEVITDKVNMEVPSPYAGVFLRPLVSEGDTVPMGHAICEMNVSSEEPSAAVVEADGAGNDEPPTEMEPVPDDGPALSDYDRAMRDVGFNVGGSNLNQQTAEEQVDAIASDDAETSASEPEEPGTEEAGDAPDHRFEFMDSVRSVGPTGSGEGGLGRIDAVEEQAADLSVSATPPPSDQPDRRHVVSPIVARLAMTLGIDITTVQGTGIGGRVTRDDMLRAAEQVTQESEVGDAPAEDAFAGDAPAEDALAAEASAPDDAVEADAPEDAPALGVAVEDVLMAEAIAEDVSALSAAVEDAAAAEAIAEEAPAFDAGVEAEAPVGETPAFDAAVEAEAIAEEAPALDAAVMAEAMAEDVSAFEDAVAAEAMAEDVSAFDATVEADAPVEEAPAFDAAVEAEASTEDAPAFHAAVMAETIAEDVSAFDAAVMAEAIAENISAFEDAVTTEAVAEETTAFDAVASTDAPAGETPAFDAVVEAEAPAEVAPSFDAGVVTEAMDEDAELDAAVEAAMAAALGAEATAEDDSELGDAVEAAPDAEASAEDASGLDDAVDAETPAKDVFDPETSVVGLTAVRRTIAAHMARSASEIPAAWSMVEVDVTGLVRARGAHRAAFEDANGVPLTYMAFAAKAVAEALRENPRLNARWDGDYITLHNRVHLSIAVSTEVGLMVPVLHDADRLGVGAMAIALHNLVMAARAGTLKREDVQGGTFTLNNTGALGSVVSVPIISHPQAGILTTESVVKRPVVIEGDAIAVRSMMNLCLTFDHRVCDGVEAGAFLGTVKAKLEAIDESVSLD